MIKKLSMSQTVAGISAGLAILAVSAGSVFGLQSAGIPLGPVEAKANEGSGLVVAPVAEYKNTPAYSVLSQSLEAAPAGWTKNSGLINSPQKPFPFSCVTDIPNTAVSLAQGYGVNGRNIQIVTGAYSAGAGAYSLKAQMDRAVSCAGNTFIATVPVTGLGAEAYSSTVTKGGNATRIVTWRNGDVVTYLITDNNNGDSLRNAEAFNTVLSEKLNPVCVNPNSSVDDAKRTIWSGDTYTGYLINDNVTIPAVPLPNVVSKPKVPLVGKDLTPNGFVYKSSENVVPTPLPADELDVPAVERPEQPVYPVWPLLPAEPAAPALPESPTAAPPTIKDVPIQVKDDKGPGCGWAFTATVAPNFDPTEAEQKKIADKAVATTVLKTEASSWQTSVLTYWKNYATYKAQVDAWKDYAAKVENVRAAWDKIAEQWRVYNGLLAAYETSKANNAQFLKAQADAKTQFDKETEICKVRSETEKAEAEKKKAEELKAAEEKKKAEEEARNSPSPSPTATPGATTSPSASPSPTASPTPSSADDRVTCPVERPEILDEKAPDILPQPTPPADPRPANQRG